MSAGLVTQGRRSPTDPRLRDPQGLRRLVGQVVLPARGIARLPGRHIADHQMRWGDCRPPQTVLLCAISHKRRGQQSEGYDDWGGSGKECISGPRRIDSGAFEVSRDALTASVSQVHGCAAVGSGRHGSLWQCSSLGTGDEQTRPRSETDCPAICQAFREAPEE